MDRPRRTIPDPGEGQRGNPMYKIADEARGLGTLYNGRQSPEVVRAIERGWMKKREKQYPRGEKRTLELRDVTEPRDPSGRTRDD